MAKPLQFGHRRRRTLKAAKRGAAALFEAKAKGKKRKVRWGGDFKLNKRGLLGLGKRKGWIGGYEHYSYPHYQASGNSHLRQILDIREASTIQPVRELKTC
jgi:hypothetical protein